MRPIYHAAPIAEVYFAWRAVRIAALDDLEKVMPYIPGSQAVSEDEGGNTHYEDSGPMPRFLVLLQKPMQQLGR